MRPPHAVTPISDASRRPTGILTICLIEILERYGSFLIAALLPLFLNEQQSLKPDQALRLVGYYLALTYACGILGGWLADRALGYRGATRVGALLLVLGAALLAASAKGTLYPALALLICGSGFFKPALSAWLGSLYTVDDPGRSAGYAWLYFTANIGAVLAPFVGGTLRTHYSWPVAFATSAGAFFLCLIIVVISQTAAVDAPTSRGHGQGQGRAANTQPAQSGAETPHWRTLLAWLLVIILFCLAYGQSGGALLFFTRDHVDRTLLGRVVPPDFFAAIPSAIVLVLTVLQQLVWKSLMRRQRTPAPTTLLLIGMLASSSAFGVLAAVASAHGGKLPQPLISALWIVGALLFLTLGEILVIPVAMALVSQSAPRRWGALSQGLLSVTMAAGLALAGEAGRFFIPWGAPRFFAATAVVPLVGAGVLWAVARRRPVRASGASGASEASGTSGTSRT